MSIFSQLVHRIKASLVNDAYLTKEWLNPRFDTLFNNAKLRISRERAFVLLETLKVAEKLPGNLAELGVYKGSTAYLIADYLFQHQLDNKKLYLFDTFAGTPQGSHHDNVAREGLYEDVILDDVKRFMNLFDSLLVYQPGLIPETFAGLETELFCFLHVHLNLYQSTRDTLEGLYDSVVGGGVILIEDYGLNTCRGVKKATDEFLATKNNVVIHLPTGQGLIFKRG